MEEKRKLATIRKVKEIRPIPGADKIELAIVDGWQCVIRKGNFKPGDYGVYFEIDSFLPIEYDNKRYEFLKDSCYRELENQNPGYRDKGYRIKTIKLRGQLSQGLLMPINEFPELIGEMGVSTLSELKADFSKTLNVTIYHTPIAPDMMGKVKGVRPAWIQRTGADMERIQNVFDEYSMKYKNVEFEVTEKLDGTSKTVYWKDGKFGICSRNLDFQRNDNIYWQVAEKIGLEKALRNLGMNIALQGELIGPGIQKNRLQLKERDFYLFDIWDIDKQRYLDGFKRQIIFDAINLTAKLKHVPMEHLSYEVFCGKDATLTNLLRWANGSSLINQKVKREGLVFKSIKHVDGEIIKFKIINNAYLLKEGE